MARGSANNVVEVKTRSKKGAPIKEKDSKKTPTAIQKVAMPKAEKTTVRKCATKASSEVKTNIVTKDNEDKEIKAAVMKTGNKKNQKEVSKEIKKPEVSTSKSEKVGRKRKINEADELVNDKANENKSGETVKKRTKTSNVAENIPNKVTKKSEKATIVKNPVRRAKNSKKVFERELNEDTEKETVAETKNTEAELTQEITSKKTVLANKNSNKASEKESNPKSEKGKRALPISPKTRNAKKNVADSNIQNDGDKIVKEEGSDDSKSCEVEVSAKGTKKKPESKTGIKVRKNTIAESSSLKTRGTKKPQEPDLPKSCEEGNQAQEGDDSKTITEANQSTNKKIEFSGRKTRNIKKTEEANTNIISAKLDHNSGQLEIDKENDQLLNAAKSRNFKRGTNKKNNNTNITDKVSKTSVNENKASANESQSKIENGNTIEKTTSKQSSLKSNASNAKKTEESNMDMDSAKLDQNNEHLDARKEKDQVFDVTEIRNFKRGTNKKNESISVINKVSESSVNENNLSAEESQPEIENKNLQAFEKKTRTKQKMLEKKDDSDVTVFTRKTKRGVKNISTGESSEKVQVSADEENSNSNSSDLTKATLSRKKRKEENTISDKVITEQIQISSDMKYLDEENSNSNLSNAADSIKTTLIRKTRRRVQTISDKDSVEQMQISAETNDLDEENSNSNLSNTSDSARTTFFRKSRRGTKTVLYEKSSDGTQISSEIKDLNKEDSNLSNTYSVKAVPTRKTRRTVKTVSDKDSIEQSEISAEAKELGEENNNLPTVANSSTATFTRKIRKNIKPICKEKSNTEKRMSTEMKDTESVLNKNMTSVENSINERTRSSQMSKQKCDQPISVKKIRTKLQINVEELVNDEQIDETLLQKETNDSYSVFEIHKMESINLEQMKNATFDEESMPKLQIAAETKNQREENSNSSDFPNLETSASSETVRDIKTASEKEYSKQEVEKNFAAKNSNSFKLPDDTSASGSKETQESEQTSINDLKKEKTSRKRDVNDVHVNENIAEEIACTANTDEVIKNLFPKSNSESNTENNFRENHELEITSEMPVVIEKENGNSIIDIKNDLLDVEHRVFNEIERIEKMPTGKKLAQNIHQEKGIEIQTSINNIHRGEHDSIISNTDLDLTENLELQEDQEIQKSNENENVKTAELKEVCEKKSAREGFKVNTELLSDVNDEISESNKCGDEIKIVDTDLDVTEENTNKSSQKISLNLLTNMNVENEELENTIKADVRTTNKEISLKVIHTSEDDNESIEISESKKNIENNKGFCKQFCKSENFQNLNTYDTLVLSSQNTDELSSKESRDLHTKYGDTIEDKNYSDEPNSKDSYLNENKISREEFSIDKKINHFTKSPSDRTELSNETSAVSEKDLFLTSDDLSQHNGTIDSVTSELRIMDVENKQNKTFANPDQLYGDLIDNQKQNKSLDLDKQPDGISSEGTNHLTETSGKTGQLEENELLKENSSDDVPLKESYSPVHKQTTETLKNDEMFDNNQCNTTFSDSNKKLFFDSNDQIDNELAIDHPCKISVDNNKNLNVVPLDASDHVNKTSVDNYELLNEVSIDDYMQVNAASNDVEKFSQPVKTDHLLEESVHQHIAHDEMMNTDGDLKLNETVADSNQQSKNISVMDDCEEIDVTTVDGAELLETSTKNSLVNSLVVDSAKFLNEFINNQQASVVNEAAGNSDEMANESLVAIDNQLLVGSDGGELINDTSLVNRKLNESSVHDEQLNETSSDNNKGVEDLHSSVDSDHHLIDVLTEQDQLKEPAVNDDTELNDVLANNSEEIEHPCFSIDPDQQLKEALIDNQLLNEPTDDVQSNETLVNKKLFETSVSDKEQPKEALVDGKQQLNELPIFESGQLDISVKESKQLKGMLSDDDKHPNITSGEDSSFLKGITTIDNNQLEESSSDIVQLKDSSISGVTHLKQPTPTNNVELKELSTSDAIHLKEPSINNNMHASNLQTENSMQFKGLSSESDMLLKKDSTNDSVEALDNNSRLSNETSVDCNELTVTTPNHEQSKKLSEDNNHLLENFSDHNEQLNEINSSLKEAVHCNEAISLQNIDHDFNQDKTSSSVKVTDDMDKKDNSSVVPITEQKNVNIEVSVSNQSKELVSIESVVTVSEYSKAIEKGEGNKCNEEDISDESNVSVLSPKILTICEEQNLEDESEILTFSKIDTDSENIEVSSKKSTVTTSEGSEESVSCDLEITDKETNNKTCEAVKVIDLNELPNSTNKPSMEELSKISQKHESSSTFTKRVDSGTISIVKKDGNRKKTKLIKTSGKSKQISEEELKRLSENIEQSISSEISSNKKNVKRRSEDPENSSLETGLDCSTEISVAIKIKKKESGRRKYE